MEDEKKSVNLEEKKKIETATKISVKEGVAFSVMDGFGLRYITPYALALGASSNYISLLSSVPGLLGNMAQLPSLHLMKKNSRKKIIILSTFFQALLWLPIIAVGFFYFIFGISTFLAFSLLIVSYSLMIIAGSVAGPAWSSWMKDIVQENSGEYFGRRNKIAGIVAITGMFVAGVILNYFGKRQAFFGFLIIFIIAFIGRSFSSYLFTKKYEPPLHYEPTSHFSFIGFLKKMPFNNFGRFVIFVSLISFAVAIASPFFAVYMLKDLNLSYINFTLITLSSAFTTILFMPLWGKFADKYGNVKVLKITSLFIPLVPLFWMCSVIFQNYLLVIYLIFAEAFTGFVFAGFNLSAGNFIYDAVTRQRMARCVSYFNFINSFGVFVGAIIGGFLASQENLIFGLNAILFVFIISAIMRLLIAVIFSPILKEVRQVKDFRLRQHIKEKLKIGTENLWRYIGFKPIRIVSSQNQF